MKRILTLAGGGVRGAMQLDTLKYMEDYYGKPIYQIYDLIVGTSVGAITGGLLATGLLNMEEYKEKFIEFVPLVFKTHWWKQTGLFGPLYNRDNFYHMWNKYFGKLDIKLTDLKTKFVCTAINLCDNQVHLFRSWEDKYKDDLLHETIAKSFAAPYYFGQYRDKKNQAVWIDGGVGDSNCPLDWAFTETLLLGWENEHKEFTVIGTGDFNKPVSFRDIKSTTDLKRIVNYMDPIKGGFARVQSTLNQIRRMQFIAQADPNIDFNVIQLHLPKKYEPLDRVKDLSQYLYYGKIMASQVARQFNEKGRISISPSDYICADYTCMNVTPHAANEFILKEAFSETLVYLDLFNGELRKEMLKFALIKYFHKLEAKNPEVLFRLFFYSKENDPIMSDTLSNESDIISMVDLYWQDRNRNYSDLENGLIFSISHIASQIHKYNQKYQLLIFSDLASTWGNEIWQTVTHLLQTIDLDFLQIDIVRFGMRENFPDNQKLEALTQNTGGQLVYKKNIFDLTKPNLFNFLMNYRYLS